MTLIQVICAPHEIFLSGKAGGSWRKMEQLDERALSILIKEKKFSQNKISVFLIEITSFALSPVTQCDGGMNHWLKVQWSVGSPLGNEYPLFFFCSLSLVLFLTPSTPLRCLACCQGLKLFFFFPFFPLLCMLHSHAGVLLTAHRVQLGEACQPTLNLHPSNKSSILLLAFSQFFVFAMYYLLNFPRPCLHVFLPFSYQNSSDKHTIGCLRQLHINMPFTSMFGFVVLPLRLSPSGPLTLTFTSPKAWGANQLTSNLTYLIPLFPFPACFLCVFLWIAR